MNEYKESEFVEVGDIDFKELDIKPFDLEDYKEFNEKLSEGKIQINISATTVIFQIFIKIIKHINDRLDKMLSKKEVSSTDVKMFVVAYLKLDLAEYILYSAF